MNQPKDTLLINEGAWKAAGQDTFIRQHFIEVQAHDLVALKPTIDPDGSGLLYWYIGINGDTVALSHELTTFEYEMPILMKQPFRASDTIQPSDYVHGTVQSFNPYYPIHIHPVDTSFNSEFDYAAGVAIFLIALAYVVRCSKTNAWGNLFKDLRNAWNNPTTINRSI
jgi:hypothetical protein